MKILKQAVSAINSNANETFHSERLADAFGIDNKKFTDYTYAKGWLTLCEHSARLTGKDVIFLAYQITNFTSKRLKWANKDAIAKCLTKELFKDIIKATESSEDSDIINSNSLEARTIAKAKQNEQNELKLKSMAKTLEATCENVDVLNDKVANLEANNAHIISRLTKLEADNARLIADNARLEADNAQLKANNSRLEAKLDMLLDYMKSTLTNVQSKVKSAINTNFNGPVANYMTKKTDEIFADYNQL